MDNRRQRAVPQLRWRENRIILAHPENRFGAYPIAPLIADDYYETYGVVVSLYRFVLTGAPLPETT